MPTEKFGRQVGIYSSFQALGGGLGPVIGGIAADTDWRYAFWGTMVIAGVLALFPPQGEARTDAEAPRIRPLLTGRMIMLGLAFLFAAAGPIGISVLVGVAAREILDLTGTQTGVILFAGAMAALALGPIWGQILDRYGTRAVGLASAIASTLLAASLALAVLGNGWSLGIVWILTSAAISAFVVALQGLGASIMPANRGGALSFLLSFRFVGHAVGPILFLPLIDTSATVALLLAAALGIFTAAVVGVQR